MNKALPFLLAFTFFSLSLSAQLTRKKPEIFKNPVSKLETLKSGNERINIPKDSYLKQPASIPSYGDTVGYTWYDLQTNAGVSNRIHQDDNGNIQVVWTKALDTIQDPTVALRGIGYNYYDASSGTWNPGDSLNQPFGISDIRVGWPSIAPIAGNSEIVFGHPRRLFSNPTKGATAYSAIDLTTTLHGTTGEPFQWYNTAAEGNSIYAVAQVGSASMEFGRSDDGGLTWAIAGLFPDSAAGTPLRPTGADGYDIDVKGDSVAIVSGGYTGYSGTEPNNLMLFLSTDRGVTWTSTVVHVFDTVNAVFDSASGGYIVLTPHPDARVLIAADGSIHVTGSLMASLTNPGDLTSNSWYPLTRGIWYWNSNMPAGFDLNDPTDYDTYILTDSIPDLTTMGTYPETTAEQASYVAGSFTHPNLTECASGNLYIVFDAVTCGSNNNPFDNLYRRDLFGMASGDGGMNWNEPRSIASLLFANDITDGTVGEEAFPNATKRTNNAYLHILFQYDSYAGTSLVDQTYLEKNSMTYLALDKTLLGISDDNKISEKSFNIYPNPTSGSALVSFEASVKGNSSVVLSNLIGQTLKSLDIKVEKGVNNVSMDLNGLSKGVYIVSIANGNNKLSKKLVIE